MDETKKDETKKRVVIKMKCAEVKGKVTHGRG